MSSDIICHLQLDKEFTTSRVIVAKENGCDSSFIVSCVLGHCIKNKKPVLILSLHNTLSHYQNVGLKMNYNLQKYVENGQIDFYDLGKRNLDALMSNKKCCSQIMKQELEQRLLKFKERHSTVNVIVDGLGHLFDLQYTLQDVNCICKDIIDFVRNISGGFVVLHCNVDDDITHVISNLLAHKAHTVVDVEGLSSGLSADVSGRLTIRHPGQKFQNEHMFTLDLKPSRFLFKLFDRGVKLFAPGTV